MAFAGLALNEKPVLAPLMYVYDAQTEDYFYSTSWDEIDLFMENGYDDLPTPEKIGIAGYLDKTSQTNTIPFLTTTEHILSKWVPGSKPLYRLTYTNIFTGELTYFYTTFEQEVLTHLARGYVRDGFVGYIYEFATTNNLPYLENGRVLGRRCLIQNFYCGGETYRDYFFEQGINIPTLIKPGSTNYHQLSFDFTTWDGLGVDTGHSAIMLRNYIHYDQQDILATRFEGVGIIIGAYGCAANTGGDRITVELWRPDTGSNGQAYVDCEMLSPPLQKGVKYRILVRSHNNGMIYYSISHKNKIIFEISKNIKGLFENMGGTHRSFPHPQGFKGKYTNYSILHAGDARIDFTQYYENIESRWFY